MLEVIKEALDEANIKWEQKDKGVWIPSTYNHSHKNEKLIWILETCDRVSIGVIGNCKTEAEFIHTVIGEIDSINHQLILSTIYRLLYEE